MGRMEGDKMIMSQGVCMSELRLTSWGVDVHLLMIWPVDQLVISMSSHERSSAQAQLSY